MVAVTTRNRLSELMVRAGGVRTTLGVLSDDEAGQLFGRVVGHRRMVRRTVEPGAWPRAVRYELSTVAQDLLTATVPAVLWSRQHAAALSQARAARPTSGTECGTPVSRTCP